MASQIHWCPWRQGRLALRHWGNRHQTDVPGRGFVCLVHGMGEHSARYHEYATFLTQFGFDVLAVDLPGHGLSWKEGGLTSLLDLKNMRQALYASFDWARREGPMSKAAARAPWYLVGHSMGALLCLTWMLEARAEGFEQEFAERAFLSAPPLKLRLPVPHWKTQLAENMLRALPTIRIDSGIRPEHLSVDGANRGRVREDACMHHDASPALFLSMEQAAKAVLLRGADVEIPVMLAVGADDPIVDADVLQEFTSSLGTHRSFLRIAGARHEIFNERGRRALYEASVSWLT